MKNSNLKKSVSLKKYKKLNVFVSMYKRWIITILTIIEIKTDCKNKLKIVTINMDGCTEIIFKKLQKQSRARYRELSNEKEYIKREYGKNRYRNMTANEKLISKMILKKVSLSIGNITTKISFSYR